MLSSLSTIWSTILLLVHCTWQMTKIFARFYAAVIPATAMASITRQKRRKYRLDRYRLECGAWALRATIRVSGRAVSLSSLSLTKRMEEAASSYPEITLPPAARRGRVAPSPPEQFGRQFEPWALEDSL